MKRKIFALIFIAGLIGLVVLLNTLAHRYNARFDLTKAKQHTLSRETVDFLHSLEQDISITVLHVDMPPKYLLDMLKEYERISKGRVTAKITDPLVDIGYAAQFGNIITGDQRKAVVQSRGERRDVDFTNDVLTEEVLTNAVIRVLGKERQVYFLVGHGEFKLGDEEDHGLSIFNQLLAANNIKSYELLLESTKTVPDDCDVLVVAGPQSDLSGEEYRAIDEYLKRGGDALFLVEHIIVTTPDKPLSDKELELNPSMNELLNKWGIKVNKDVVVDVQSHASGDVGSPATNNYLTHRSIVAGLDYTFYVRPRSISIVPGRRATLKVAPIVLTQSEQNSWGETDRMLNIKYDAGLDRAGPVPLAFVIWEEKQGEEESDTRLVVFTDADFLTNAYIGAVSNAQMGLNVINWLSETDYKSFVTKKVFEVEKLNLLSHQKKRIRLILIFIPVLILLTGIGVWLKK